MRGFEDVPVNWSPASIWTDDNGTQHTTVEFIVPGDPISQGNMIQNRYGRIYDKTKGLREWRAKVTAQAQAAMKGGYRRSTSGPVELDIITGPVLLDVTFVLDRPKSTPKRQTPPAIKKPDLSKLVRAIEDSMTGVVYVDDAQIIETLSRKRLADIGEIPGAHILITTNVSVP